VGEGDHVILINKAIHLRCMDRIKVSASVPGTRDIIEVVGPVGETWFSIKNCNITPVSGAPGRVGVEINATSTSNGSNYIARMVLEGNTIGPFGSSGVKVSFPDYQDGYFNSVISRNMIYGGIDFTRAGDTIEIANNTLVGTGPKSAIYLESVFGASQVDIHHNSIVGCSANVTLGHSIHVEAGSGVRIRSNNIEPVGCSLGDSAVYLRGKDLNPSPYPGTTGHIYGASVTDNSFVNIPLVVKFGLKVSARNHGTAVYGNRFSLGGTYDGVNPQKGIWLEALAAGNYIHSNALEGNAWTEFITNDAPNLNYVSYADTTGLTHMYGPVVFGPNGYDTWRFAGNYLEQITPLPFASLPDPTGKVVITFCNDCNVASPCTGGGIGAWAFSNGGAFNCPF
jgi:hypothetical protein